MKLRFSISRERASRLAVLSLVASGWAAFSCAGSDGLVVVGAGETGDSGTPNFVSVDASGQDANVDGPTTAPQCATTQCTAPFATCAPSGTVPTYRCATNLSNDRDNCGACGNSCGSVAGGFNMLTSCVNSTCVGVCADRFLDCNGVVDDGCETDPAVDARNCGGCGLQCESGVKCIDGHCGCLPGYVECNGRCTDVRYDENNCGACGYACAEHMPEDAAAPPSHMRYTCNEKACGVLACETAPIFWADCNDDLGDGCEVALSGDPNNCGACGKVCAPGKSCFAVGGYYDCQCPTGKTMCDGSRCIDLESDPYNCGSCDYACPDPVRLYQFASNGHTTCGAARCGYECNPGFADCNGRADDGCEVDLSKDPQHCGSCGTSCDNAMGQPCVNGACATTNCDAGTTR